MDVQSLAKKVAKTVVSIIDEKGVESVITDILKGIGDKQD